MGGPSRKGLLLPSSNWFPELLDFGGEGGIPKILNILLVR